MNPHSAMPSDEVMAEFDKPPEGALNHIWNALSDKKHTYEQIVEAEGMIAKEVKEQSIYYRWVHRCRLLFDDGMSEIEWRELVIEYFARLIKEWKELNE